MNPYNPCNLNIPNIPNETIEDLAMSKYYDYEVENPHYTLLDKIKSLIFS